ncbi:hypothetical protein SNEBB_006454 [Seison nebaliae]|nr:hypothetical protein SNEBB_006454 [Seison nebaliae]
MEAIESDYEEQNFLDSVKFLKKITRGGEVEVHPVEDALIVEYTIEATLLDDNDREILSEVRDTSKVIRLHNLREESPSSITQQIIDKCPLINENQREKIEKLVSYLKKRDPPNERTVSKTAEKLQAFREKRKERLNAEIKDPGTDFGSEDVANLRDIEIYTDMIYEEDVKLRIQGTQLLLQLARNPDNLDDLCSSESLLNMLSRVLKEEKTKNIEIATNVTYVFFCFSSFSLFHNILKAYKIGATTIELINEQIEYSKKMELMLQQQQKKKDNYKKFQFKQEQYLRVAFYLLFNMAEDVRIEIKMQKKKIIPSLCYFLRRSNEDLIIIVLSFLKRLSIRSENKEIMIQEKIAPLLERILVNSCGRDLQTVLLRLIFNLSFDTKFRRLMIRLEYIGKLTQNIGKCPIRNKLIFQIFYLISTDKHHRECFADNEETIKILIKLFAGDKERCTIDYKFKYVDDNGTSSVVESNTHFLLLSILANLATDSKCSQYMSNVLKYFLKRAFRKKDALLMKFVRNICSHDKFTPEMVEILMENLEKLLEIVVNFKDDFFSLEGEEELVVNEKHFVLECVGLLSNITMKELDWEHVLQEYKLINWTVNRLATYANDCDEPINIEIITLLGTLCRDPNTAELISKTTTLTLLQEILQNLKESDDKSENVLVQIFYVFYQMIYHKSTRDEVLKNGVIPRILLKFLSSKNMEIRRVCTLIFDIIADYNDEWRDLIQMEKFRLFNNHWLKALHDKPQRTLLDESNEFDDWKEREDLDYNNSLLNSDLDRYYDSDTSEGFLTNKYSFSGSESEGNGYHL